VGKEKAAWDRLFLYPGYFTVGLSDFPVLNADEKIMLESLKGLPFFQQIQLIYKENGQFYFLNPCYFGLFKWDGSHWQEVSGLNLTGYNCSPYFFFKGQRAAMLTGLGYWQGRSDLFYLDEGKKPTFIPTQNQPEDYSGRLIFKTQRGVFSLLGDPYNVTKNVKGPFLDGFFLELETNAWKKVQLQFNKEFKNQTGRPALTEEVHFGGAFESQDYAGIEFSHGPGTEVAWLMVNKNSLELFLKKMPKNYLEKALWIQQEGNLLRFMTSESFKFKEIQLDELTSSSVLVGRLEIRETPTGLGEYLPDWESASIFLAMILMIAWIFWKTLKVSHTKEPLPEPKEDQVLSGNYELWLKRLAPYSGQVISQKQLEEILGVQDIKNQDLRKVRRSRAIKELNDQMQKILDKPFIQRERDEQDKRVIHYQIAKIPKEKFSHESSKSSVSALN
jgi:hypothetical protein